MKISKEDVIRVAQLAHLDLSSAEIETYRGQLDAILDYVDKLKELDVTGIDPMAQALPVPASGTDDHPELRDDVPRPCDVADPVLASAPDAAKPFFRVPKVIER